MSLKTSWDNLLKDSVILASLLVFSVMAITVLIIGAVAVLIAKVLVFIK